MRPTQALSFLLLLYLAVTLMAASCPVVYSPITGEPTQGDLHIFFASWDGSSWTEPQPTLSGITANSTEWSFQRKVWKDTAGYYWIGYFNYNSHYQQIMASSDGEHWQVVWQTLFSTYPFSRYDYVYPSHWTIYNGSSYRGNSAGSSMTWKPFTLSGTTYTEGAGGAVGIGGNGSGGSIESGLRGIKEYMVFHQSIALAPWERTTLQTSTAAYNDYWEGGVGQHGTSGGNQILNYKTSDPYHLLVISKGSDRHLYWTLVNETTKTFVSKPFNNLSVTLGEGYNDFCATTEAQDIGDPERVHLVFGNSSGLFYLKFESDTWSSPAAIGSSGTYPTLNVDDSGNLLLTYVANGVIKYRTKTPAGAWSSEQTLQGTATSLGTYSGAAYCSSNHNMDSGEILLVWTAYELVPFHAATIAAPYAYAAIALMSIALTVGVGAVFITSLQTEDFMLLFPVVVIGIAVVIILFIALPILNAFMGL